MVVEVWIDVLLQGVVLLEWRDYRNDRERVLLLLLRLVFFKLVSIVLVRNVALFDSVDSLCTVIPFNGSDSTWLTVPLLAGTSVV